MKQTALNLFFLAFFCASGISQSPNIVFILLDDLGYADVGFNNGALDIATPNIDQLAKNGTIFSSAYAVHPFCGPSRAGLMTGRYPHEIGAQFNLNDNEYVLGVDTSEPFFSSILQTAGYNTGLIGKWHLGQSATHYPNARGFDYFYGMLTGGHNFFTGTTANGGFSGAYNRPLRKNDGLANEPFNEYITDLFSDEGVTFIQNAENNDSEPFFLFMSYNAPHTPIQALESDKTILTSAPYSFSYPNTTAGNYRHTYAAMVYAVDRGIKKLIDALKANGEYDNTLIVFMSDNGGRQSANGSANNAPLRGVKGDTYEGGFRVPMFMHWPNNIPSGTTYNYNVTALDLYPTFVNLANGTIPNTKELDGKDILDHIKNNTDARAGESVYTIRHRRINNVGIRRDNLKAYSTGNGRWFLFDLNTNIGENNNQDLSNNPAYEAILEDMINDAYKWSLTHIEPKFFDSPQAADTWYEYNSSTNPANTIPWQDITFNGFTLGVDDFELDENLLGYIYPNPVAEAQLSIRFNQEIYDNIEATIYDALGRPVQIERQSVGLSRNEFKMTLMPNITPGTYFIKISAGEYVFNKTFVVKY